MMKKIILITLAMSYQSANAFKFKAIGISICHNCSHGPQVNVDKAVKNTSEAVVDLTKDGVETAKNLGEAAKSVVSATGNLVEAGVQTISGDQASAANAVKRAKNNIHNAGEKGDRWIDQSLNLGFKSLRVPSFLLAKIADDTFQTSGNYTHFVKKTSAKVGAALNVVAEPQNLAKVAFVTGAAAIGGPLGSAFANVIYDKVVMKKSMSDKEMFVSFVVGAGAGYAAEASNSAVLNSKVASRSLAESVSGIARNLTSDAGKIVLNKEGYTFKQFIESLARGAAQVQIDDNQNMIAQVLDSTITAGLDSTVAQSIENKFEHIDLQMVSHSMINGFASGAVEQPIRQFVNVSLDKALPDELKRVDKKAFNAIADTMSYTFKRFQAVDNVKVEKEILAWLRSLDQATRQRFLAEVNQTRIEVLEKLAHELYNKDYDQLTDQQKYSEKLNSDFNKLYSFVLNEKYSSFTNANSNNHIGQQANITRSPSSIFNVLLSIFGFGNASHTAAEIAELKIQIVDQIDVHKLAQGDKYQWKLDWANRQLELLGTHCLLDYTAQEGIGFLQSYYTFQASDPVGEIEGISQKNVRALLKMTKQNAEDFFEKYSEMKTKDEFFLNIAKEIVEETKRPNQRLY